MAWSGSVVCPPAVRRVMGGAPGRNKNRNKILMKFGEVKYIGVIIHKMCFIPMNSSMHGVRNCVRQLRWERLFTDV